MTLSQRDQILLQRYFDREMTDVEAARFRARIGEEPALRAALDELTDLRSGFAAGRAACFAAPAGFTAGVLAEVRQLPGRLELEQTERTGQALVLCRRVLLAAAILFGLGLCWHAGLFAGDRTSNLEAGEAAQQELDKLDEFARSLPPSSAVPAPERPR